MHGDALIIFVKNPEEGRCKTRLAKTIGPINALAVYLGLLNHTKNITSNIDAARYLYYDSFIDEKDGWPGSIYNKKLQHHGDLGQRMQAAFQELFQKHNRVLIIGSDCPQLQESHIYDAYSRLEESDIIIGPSFDGGYYLLGMKKLYPFLFKDMNWSTNSVFETTMQRISENNLKAAKLETLHDLDDEDDLKKFPQFLPET